MTDMSTNIRTMQILCFGFFMGITVLLGVFSFAVYDPDPDAVENAPLFLGIVIAIMMSSIVGQKVISTVFLKQLQESTREKGSLDLSKYQTLMIMRIGLLEGPALVGIIFFFFIAKTPIEDPVGMAFFIPTVFFYLALFGIFPTESKAKAHEHAILSERAPDDNPYQTNN